MTYQAIVIDQRRLQKDLRDSEDKLRNFPNQVHINIYRQRHKALKDFETNYVRQLEAIEIWPFLVN